MHQRVKQSGEMVATPPPLAHCRYYQYCSREASRVEVAEEWVSLSFLALVQAAVQNAFQSAVWLRAISSTSGPTRFTHQRAPVRFNRKLTNYFTTPSTAPLPILCPDANRAA